MTGYTQSLSMVPAADHPNPAIAGEAGQSPRSANIVVFCDRPGPLDPLLDWLAEKGAQITHFPLRRLPLDWFDTYAGSHDVALVDADFLGDEGAMIDFGMRLRRFSPAMPVIMASRRVTTSDSSTERMAICDVTLRMPVTRGDLLEAMSAALENHSYWMEKRGDGRPRIADAPPPAA
jgi:DNA-binding response OmpR family regulator